MKNTTARICVYKCSRENVWFLDWSIFCRLSLKRSKDVLNLHFWHPNAAYGTRKISKRIYKRKMFFPAWPMFAVRHAHGLCSNMSLKLLGIVVHAVLQQKVVHVNLLYWLSASGVLVRWGRLGMFLKIWMNVFQHVRGERLTEISLRAVR